ncbi:type III secretion system effector arginine glycosyltransferase [Salmonella enterica]|nr:type III secretion system effector arginine glycosyltransferase [Salmonella enterica]
MARFNAAFTRIKIMFSRIRGLISCQSNTQTIAPTLSPPSSGHVSFAGIDYPLLPLDHQTPLVFQWFERNPDRFGQNEIPIINTQKNPYLNNIINAAIIEKERIIGIFVDGDFSKGQRKALGKLEQNFRNIKVIYNSDLNYSMYDKKLTTIYLENITKLEAQSASERDEVLLNGVKKSLEDVLKNNPEETLISSHNKDKGHLWFDFYRNLFLLKGSDAFLEAGKPGCHHLQPGGGCIYLDADMLLTDKLGTLYLPDGIAIHVSRKDNHVSLENGIIAVNRSEHPALIKGLEIMHSKPYGDPYNDWLSKGLRHYFDGSHIQDYDAFCDFIEFKHENIIMNTSSLTASSWR